MHRLNLTIDESLYEQARAFSFLENKSISQIIRESLSDYINRQSNTKIEADLILEAIAEGDPDINYILDAKKRRDAGEKTYTINEVLEEIK